MLYAKKSLGQNYLIDLNIINKIVNILNIKNKNVVEIGPGRALTGMVRRIDRGPNTFNVSDLDAVKNLKSS